MPPTFAAVALTAPLSRLESVPLQQAKAVLNNVEMRRTPGAALGRAIAIVGYTRKEAAAVLALDEGQLSRWVADKERIQLDRIYATKLHGPFAIEQARDADGCTVETTVTYRSAR